MGTSELASVAILKVNWDRQGRDYIENFVPFVAEALKGLKDDCVSLPALQQQVRADFALDLPLNPLRQILQRCAKHGFVRKSSGVFHRELAKIQVQGFAEVRASVLALEERVISRVREYAKTERGLEWSDEKVSEAIRSFLYDHGLRTLFSKAEGTRITINKSVREEQYLVGSLLVKARESDPQLFEDFIVLTKGYMLSNAIYLPDPGRSPQRFRDTKIYLDTSILVYALGYAGPERQAPCTELLESLRDYGATLYCLDKTMDEVRGVLDACAARMRRGQLRDAYGPTLEWFIESGKSASDVELMIARLPERMRSACISIAEPPVRNRDFQIDEAGFEKALSTAINYRNEKARQHDVDCVSAIALMRKNRVSFDVETCGAIFVTSNVEIARASRQFFQGEAPEGAVSLCTTDYILGNLLWLKNPTKAPDLPDKQLFADAYASIQPSDALWKAYLAEIARLQERGTISSDEYYALRHSLTAKRALMDITAGIPAAFSEGTVSEVLRVAKENMRADLQEQLATEKAKRQEAEVQVDDHATRERDRTRRIDERSRLVARRVKMCASAFLLVLLAFGALITFPFGLPSATKGWPHYLASLILCVFFLFTLANIRWGTSVASIGDKIEAFVAKKVREWLTALT